MGYSLKEDYDFSDNVVTPDVVMEDICIELNKITLDLVHGNVSEYKGQIESYSQLSGMAALAATIGSATVVDIQNQLGSIGNAKSQYELYLTASQIENYKYRILFISYNLGGYPVKVVLEQGIADEINEKEDSSYIYNIETQDLFKNFIVSILNTKKVTGVIQDLITASERKLKLFLEQPNGRTTASLPSINS